MNTQTKPQAPIPNGQGGQSQALALPQQAPLVLGSDAFRAALEPTTLDQALTLAEMMHSVGYCGVTSPADALGRIMTGRGLGLSAMMSLRGLYTVNGRQGIDAGVMHALCLQSPFCEYFRVVPDECNAEKATFVTRRKGNPEVKWTFTLDQAIRMGVVDRGKDEQAKKDSNWSKSREAMLRARARSELARLEYPDVVAGMYSREELQAGFHLVDQGVVRDPNEMAGEILSEEEAAIEAAKGSVQRPPRNYAAEADALIARCKTETTKEGRAELRKAIEAWDGVEPHIARVRAAYNETKPPKAEAAQQPAVATEPAPMPERNLFSKTEGKDK